jgi:hypothetical protein
MKLPGHEKLDLRGVTNMNHKAPIRIIKRGQRQGENRVAETGAPEDVSNLRHGAREVAGNITAWVKEFKGRRPADPRQAFAKLFAETSPTLDPLT